MTHTIRCRARLVGCLHGQPTERQFGEDLPMDEDGTFDTKGSRGPTIVCDPCYVQAAAHSPSGRGLNGSDLTTGITEAWRTLARVRERDGADLREYAHYKCHEWAVEIPAPLPETVTCPHCKATLRTRLIPESWWM